MHRSRAGYPSARVRICSGPIGWDLFQPAAQLWLYKYYGDVATMDASYNHTLAFVTLLDNTAVKDIEGGLGDWMPMEGTSTAITGLGFQREAYLAFANIRCVGWLKFKWLKFNHWKLQLVIGAVSQPAGGWVGG